MKCLNNMLMDKKDIVLKAIEISGAAIEWRDEPDERMTSDSDRANHGSIWSSANNVSDFWRAYNDLQHPPVPKFSK